MDSILVRDVVKTYRMGVGRARVREMMPWPFDRLVSKVFPRWWVRDTFDALQDVSLSIPGGSSVGIVGHNGAGKTTLLKVIGRVTAPSAGTVSVSGRIAALIDALVGFNPDLTGRENVLLLGAVHGFGRRAMAGLVDRVIDFAEVGELKDTPLKRYSAGMAARLGFATVTALDADILLVDEILAVGDAAFQRKCINWLDEYRSGGGTLLFVSHNLGLVRSMTDRTVWMDHGRIVDDGPTNVVLPEYMRAMEQRELEVSIKGARRAMLARGMDRWGAGGARLEEVHVEQPSESGNTLEISISFGATALEQAVFCVGFVDEGGRELGAAASPPLAIDGETGAVRCVIRPLPFRSGVYFPVVAILSPDGLVRDRWKLDRAVVVDGDGEVLSDFGPVTIPADWSRPAERAGDA